jgi:hypothetical protein
MQTYLDLCNTMIVELGINGGQKLSTTAPGGTSSLESERVCAMIADADYEIQSLHHNWRFLWRHFNAQLAAGFDILPTPMYRGLSYAVGGNQTGQQNLFQFRKMDRESLVFNYQDPTLANRPKFQPWRQFESLWQSRGPKSVSNSPPFFSQTPAGNIIVSTVMKDTTLFRYECWARPMRFVSDGDISPLIRAVGINDSMQDIVPPLILPQPSAGLTANQLRVGIAQSQATRNESARIILVRAKIIWAEVEGATEVMQAALAEYQDLLEELRADQLPGMEHDRVSENDVPMTVETE